MGHRFWPRGFPPRPSLPTTVVLCLCVVSFLSAGWVSTNVADRVPHYEDEYAFLFQARTFASGRLVAPAPAAPDFFWMPFTVQRDGMWFGKYPPGLAILMVPAVIVGQPWLLNPVLGAACVMLTYLVGQRLYGTATGVLGAALLTASPLFVLQSASFLSHVAALLWTLLFTLLFVSSRSRQGFAVAVAAGACAGMLFLTRPFTAVAVGAPFAAWALADLWLTRNRLRVYVGVLLGAAPFALAFLAYNQLTTGHPFTTAYELYWPYDRVGFGPGIGLSGNHTPAAGILNTRVNLGLARLWLFGWPGGLSLLPLALAALFTASGLLAATRERLQGPLVDGRPAGQRVGNDVLLFAVVVVLVLAHVAYWTPGTAYGPRYYFEIIAAAALLSARGLLQVALGLASLANRLGAPRPSLVLACCLAAVLLPTGGLFVSTYTDFAPREFGKYVGWYGIDAEGIRAVHRANLSNALVLVESDHWSDYAPFFSLNAPTLDGEVVFAIDRGPVRSRQLLSLYPDRNYYRFAHGRLEPYDPRQRAG